MVLPFEVRIPLTRSYRPQYFSEVAGQNLHITLLTRMVLTGRIPHGIIMTGMRGVGKTTLARLLAKAISCTKRESTSAEPCGKCASCVAGMDGSHMDIVELDAASHPSVEDVRLLIETASYKPVLGNFRVFILDEAHMLSKNAFAALLKTLEEPPSGVVFILATTEAERIPATIASRCIKIFLKAFNVKEIDDYLAQLCGKEGIQIEKEARMLLAEVSQGSMRDALSLLEGLYLACSARDTSVTFAEAQAFLGLASIERFHALTRAMGRKNTKDSLDAFQQMLQEGANPLQLLEQILDFFYEALCSGAKGERTFPWSDVHLHHGWQIVLQGLEDVKKAPLASKAAEIVLLRLMASTTMPTLEEVMGAGGGHGAPSGQSLSLHTNAHLQDSFAPHGAVLQTPFSYTLQAEEKPPLVETVQVASTSLGVSLHNHDNAEGKAENFPSFADFLIFLETSRQGILLAHAKRDIGILSWDPPLVVVTLHEGCPAFIPKKLEEVLTASTGAAWNVKVKEGLLAPSFWEQEKEKYAKEKEEILYLPEVQTWIQRFPDSKISPGKKIERHITLQSALAFSKPKTT